MNAQDAQVVTRIVFLLFPLRDQKCIFVFFQSIPYGTNNKSTKQHTGEAPKASHASTLQSLIGDFFEVLV